MTHDKGEHAPGHKLRVGQEGRFDFSQLDQADISNGIDDGTVTDPAAAHVLVRREWGWARTLYTGGYLKEIEGRYAPLLHGYPQTMVQRCGRRADARMTFDHPVESDATDYPAAGRWYEMAADSPIRLTLGAVRKIHRRRRVQPFLRDPRGTRQRSGLRLASLPTVRANTQGR